MLQILNTQNIFYKHFLNSVNELNLKFIVKNYKLFLRECQRGPGHQNYGIWVSAFTFNTDKHLIISPCNI